jgi:hypothetical protein
MSDGSSEIMQFQVTILAAKFQVLTDCMNISYVVGHEQVVPLFSSVS